MSYKAEINEERPVSPPSLKWFVSRNPLNPKAARKIPTLMSTKSLNCLFSVIRKSLYAFAI
jgi:hypothetical protein